MKKIQVHPAVLILILSFLTIVPVVNAQIIDNISTDRGAVFITAPFTDPIDLEKLKEMRDDVIDFYTTEYGIKPIGGADPIIPEGSAIVAYGFIIDEKGIPHQYVGIAANNESVSAVQDKAKRWRDKHINDDSKSSAVRTSSSESFEGGESIPFNGGGYCSHSSGGVTDNFESLKRPNNNNLPGDWFAIRQIFVGFRDGLRAYEF